MVATAGQAGTASAHGGAATAARPRQARAREIAQGGINTASDLVRFGLAVIRDSLDESSGLGIKEGNLSIRAGNFSLRSAEYRRRHGEELAAPETQADVERLRKEALAQREAQLTAELEAVREQRNA